MSDLETLSPIPRLLEIMRRLRDPDSGCPWDLQQDFRSLAPYTLEEACEVVEVLERGQSGELKSELGDLLFQVVFLSQLASEQRWFGFDDVATAICDKMIRRHPHVFADAQIADAEAQTHAWEQHKSHERGAQESLLDGVALALPALVRAEKLQRKAARAGFDWDAIEAVFAKVNEELDELRSALSMPGNPESVREEAGDLLFAVVNLLRHAGLDPEAALREGNRKFERRFRAVEALGRADGCSVHDAGIEVLERYWQQVKQSERSKGRAG